MNDKGQINIGSILVVFIGVIVALVLIPAIGEHAGTVTTTQRVNNVTFTFPANNTNLDLTGQEIITVHNIFNATGGEVIATANYTVREIVSTTTGVKTINIIGIDGNNAYAGQSANISYTYGSDGYADSAAARSVTDLILIFAGLAVAIFALVPTLRSKIIEMIR